MNTSTKPLSVLALVTTLALLAACERDPPAPAPPPNPNPSAAGNPGAFAGGQPTEPTSPEDPPFTYQPAGDITGCYKKTWIEGGNPHMKKDDEFCIEREGPVALFLVPGAGMQDWQACTGNQKIRLFLQGGTLYRFCARILNHPTSTPPHGSDHEVYQIVLYPPGANGKKYAMITAWYAVAGGPVHGGTAHAED